MQALNQVTLHHEFNIYNIELILHELQKTAYNLCWMIDCEIRCKYLSLHTYQKYCHSSQIKSEMHTYSYFLNKDRYGDKSHSSSIIT